MEIHNVVGLTGVFLILLAYFLLQAGKLTSLHISFSLMNAVGAVLILYSLYFDRNLASIVIELAWLSISLLGLYRGLSNRNASGKEVR